MSHSIITCLFCQFPIQKAFVFYFFTKSKSKLKIVYIFGQQFLRTSSIKPFHMKRFFSVFLLANCLWANAQLQGEVSSSVTWNNPEGIQTRSLSIYTPSNFNPDLSYSLIIGFHGLGDTPSDYLNWSNIGLKSWANNSQDFGNIIIACPDEGSSSTSWVVGEEDFGIITAIKQKMLQDYPNINPDAVFAQGFSYGGKSAFLHGLAEADQIAGILVFSGAFYGNEDLQNACVSQNCIDYHHDFLIENAADLYICSSAGGGSGYVNYGQPTYPSEGYMTPLLTEDQTGATWHDTFLGLAIGLEAIINNSYPEHAKFLGSSNSSHALPPISISQQCWDFVQQGVQNTVVSQPMAQKCQVYPTLAEDRITFVCKAVQSNLQILSSTGLLLVDQKINDYQTTIDISDFNSGVYMLKYDSDMLLFVKY